MADPRHPSTSYNAEYPYNRVTVTESGHMIEMDDTPGHERIRYAHRTGTYWEISPDGRKVELVVANDYRYVKGGLTLTIDNNSDVKIAGNHRLSIGGDAHIEIAGKASVAVSGDAAIAVAGNMATIVGGDAFNKVYGNMTTKVDGMVNAIIGKDLRALIAGKADVNVLGNIKITSGANIDIIADQTLTLIGKAGVVINGATIKLN